MNDVLLGLDHELFKREHARPASYRQDEDCVGRAVRDCLHCQALSWAGRRLVRWGSRLQQRYGTEPAPALWAAGDNAQPAR